MSRLGGTGGLSRPSPAMMPKTQGSTPDQTSIRGSGRSDGSRHGHPSSQERPGGGGFGGPPIGGPTGGPDRSGSRGRDGGTQGASGRDGASGRRGRKSKKQCRQELDQMEAPTISGVRLRGDSSQTVRLCRGASPTDLVEKIGIGPASLVQVLFHLGETVTATQSVAGDTPGVLGAEPDYDIEVVSPEDEDRELPESFGLEPGENIGSKENLRARPLIVTVMGYVDRGKTKLLDVLRHTNVMAGEAGSITQAIGTCQIGTEVDGEEHAITFIDTPGHEAFTVTCVRGVKLTDIAVLVIAANDGVIPQTTEALNHAKVADMPIAVAVNKVDKPTADPVRVRGQLSEFGLVPEEYGGETQFVDVSVVTHEGLNDLFEVIILTADATLDLWASPGISAQGVAIETHLDKGCGPVATVLVHRGTLRTGDSIAAGPAHGYVCALTDDQGGNVIEALSSMPVQVLGLTLVPGAGGNFLVVEDDRMARQIVDKREACMRATQQAKTNRRKTLDQLSNELQRDETQEFLLVLKGDGAGSVETLEDALSQIDVDGEVSLRVIGRGVGAITKTNVSLATTSKAVIIGFDAHATAHAAQPVGHENTGIRHHSVICAATNEIESALEDMLKPVLIKEIHDQAEVRETFCSPKFGNTAGYMVTEGSIKRNQKARLLRDGVVVAETPVASLRCEKDDVTRVREGFECGMTLNNYNGIYTGDVIEAFGMVEREWF